MHPSHTSHGWGCWRCRVLLVCCLWAAAQGEAKPSSTANGFLGKARGLVKWSCSPSTSNREQSAAICAKKKQMLPNSNSSAKRLQFLIGCQTQCFSMQNAKKKRKSCVCSTGTLHLPIHSSNVQDYTTVLLLALGKKCYVGHLEREFFSACVVVINYTLKKKEDRWLWNCLVVFCFSPGRK